MSNVKPRILALLITLQCSLVTRAYSARADDLAGAAGIEVSLLDRVTNGGSESNIFLFDYLTVGVPLNGSMEVADSFRAFAEFTPVLRLKNTELGILSGFHWDAGVTYEIDESLYARGSLRLQQERVKKDGVNYVTYTLGFNPRFGYRTEIDPDLFWFVEGETPLLFLTKTKHLPEIILVSGVEKKF